VDTGNEGNLVCMLGAVCPASWLGLDKPRPATTGSGASSDRALTIGRSLCLEASTFRCTECDRTGYSSGPGGSAGGADAAPISGADSGGVEGWALRTAGIGSELEMGSRRSTAEGSVETRSRRNEGVDIRAEPWATGGAIARDTERVGDGGSDASAVAGLMAGLTCDVGRPSYAGVGREVDGMSTSAGLTTVIPGAVPSGPTTRETLAGCCAGGWSAVAGTRCTAYAPAVPSSAEVRE
jgi:hypothetical protein